MLGADALRHAEQPAIDFQRIDLAERGEHRPQLEGDEAVAVPSEIGMGGNEPLVRQARQAVRREDDGDAAVPADGVDLAEVGVAVEGVARPVADEGAADERTAAQNGARPGQHFEALAVVEQMDVAGVHVDGRRQAGVGSAHDVSGERGPIDGPVGGERQQYGGDAFDLASRAEQGKGVDGIVGHGASRCADGPCNNPLIEGKKRGGPRRTGMTSGPGSGTTSCVFLSP